jgi:hypothetical protein
MCIYIVSCKASCACAREGVRDGSHAACWSRPGLPPPPQVHFNYTISRCPPGSHVQLYLNDVQVGGDGSMFWCKADPSEGPPRAAGAAFMWHGLSGVMPGATSFHVILQQGAVAVAYASVHFDVVEGHGRFFGVNLTTLVDGHGTAAYFRSPANRSVVRWDPEGIPVELLALNFIPGRHGYRFHVVADTAPGNKFSRVCTLYSDLYSKYTRALTFENFCQTTLSSQSRTLSHYTSPPAHTA